MSELTSDNCLRSPLLHGCLRQPTTNTFVVTKLVGAGAERNENEIFQDAAQLVLVDPHGNLEGPF